MREEKISNREDSAPDDRLQRVLVEADHNVTLVIYAKVSSQSFLKCFYTHKVLVIKLNFSPTSCLLICGNGEQDEINSAKTIQ